MGLLETILSCFRRGTPQYQSVDYTLLEDGAFELRAEKDNKTVIYRSNEQVAIEGGLVLRMLQEYFYGRNTPTPELYLPSLTVSVAIEPFETGMDIIHYDDDDNEIGRETKTWTVDNAVDYTKIFHDRIRDTTIGINKTTGTANTFFAAKVEGKIICSLPIPDPELATVLTSGWEKQFLHEYQALDVLKYERSACRLLKRSLNNP